MKKSYKFYLLSLAILIIAISSGDIKAGIVTINLKCFLQGYYNPVTNLNRSTSPIIITLRDDANILYGNISTTLSTSGDATANISIPAAGDYYLKIKGWNMLETWSKKLLNVPAIGTYSVDLTEKTNIFGENGILVDNSPLRYGIYVGDVFQTGTIGLAEVSAIDNDAYNFVCGPVETDIDGDGCTDISDLGIVDNNVFHFVNAIIP